MWPRLLSHGIPCGSIQGVPLRIHILLPIMIVVLTAYFITSVSDSFKALAFALLIWGPITCGTLFVRLLGRAYAMKRYNSLPDQFILWPLGYVILGGVAPGPKEDLLTVLAGAVTHIPQAAAWVLLAWISQPQGRLSGVNVQGFDYHVNAWLHSLCWFAVWINVSVCLFNIFVPAHPLEGGRILVDSMLLAGFSIRTTAVVTVWASVVSGVSLVAFGTLPMFRVYSCIVIGLGVLWSTYVLWKYVQEHREEQHYLFTCISLGEPEQEQELGPGAGADPLTHTPAKGGVRRGPAAAESMPAGKGAQKDGLEDVEVIEFDEK